MSKHIKADTRIQNLEYANSWSHLSTKEKNYAYYMSKASWEGALIVLHQESYETPALFCIFQSYFAEKNFEELENAAKATGVSSEDWGNFLAYVGGVYGNLSNYHSFGDMKFVPDVSPDAFKAILTSNPTYAQNESIFRRCFDQLYPQIEKEIFAYEAPYTQINYPSDGGVTAYFSRNMSKEDLALVSDFLRDQKIDILNTRAFKTGEKHFLITVGSISAENSKQNVSFKDSTFDIKYGEFSAYLQKMVSELEKVLPYCANEQQTTMIQKYIESYASGSIDAHKDSQRAWILDKGPVVESNMGWVETYLDPTNERAYYEGWVAIVDKEKSKKFQQLVKNSEQVIPQLPWPRFMEKESFLAPDFTTLEIICFATNSCPLGINIPNYDDIRDNVGFKNVFLNNSLGSYTINSVQFATPEQTEILCKETLRSYEIHVACHELLGHGVGKLIYRTADGKASSFVDPVNGETFESCYEEGETWNGKFGSISTSYEECRADTCGFYLCQLKDVYTLFGFEDSEIKRLLWVNVMNQFRKGILGLQLFNADTKKWGQAHTQGAYVFAQYLYKNQPCEMIKFEIAADGQNFFIHIDEEKLWEHGRDMIKQFLIIIQTYKSSGCVERGRKFYEQYSEVYGEFLEIRKIVLDKKKPRRIELNNNLVRFNETNVEPNHYPECFEGIIASYADRFKCTQEFIDTIVGEWDKTKNYLRVE